MAHLKETDEEFDARQEAYSNQPDKDIVDGKFVKLKINDLTGMDLISASKMNIAAMKFANESKTI